MDVVPHDSLLAYEGEYNRVRGALIAEGTSLNAWLKSRGISRQLAYSALRGQSQGKKPENFAPGY
ncbi:hypothetical protein ACFQWF_12085 [Methylorubrum suomiense]